MYVKIKLIENQEDDLVSGTFHIETYSKAFVDELKKYKCPFRLSKYLTDEENKSYTPLSKPLKDERKYNFIIEKCATSSFFKTAISAQRVINHFVTCVKNCIQLRVGHLEHMIR